MKFELEVPSFFAPWGNWPDLADAALFLVETRSGMRRELTWGNLMHISFSFDVGLAWFLALSELPRLQKFRKWALEGTTWSRLKMPIHDDQKAKSSPVNHSRILGHELGYAGHGSRAPRCVCGLPDSFWTPGKALPCTWNLVIPTLFDA